MSAFSFYTLDVSKNSFKYKNKQHGAILGAESEQTSILLKEIKIIMKTKKKINCHHYYCRLFRICIKRKT